MIHSDSIRLLALNKKWIAVLVFLVCAAVVPLVTHSLMDHPPEYDELLHVLAARGIAQTGEPVIDEGVYSRAELYTRLIASVRGFSDNELRSSRIPALVCAMLLAGVIGAWVALRRGWLAGLTAGVVFAIVPPTINLAVIARFYTPHALVITILLILIYEASLRFRNGKFLVFTAIGTLCLGWLAFSLHDVTTVALGGAVAGLAALVLFDLRGRYMPYYRRKPILWSAVLLSGAVSFVMIVWQVGAIDMLRSSTPVWSEGRADHYAFYLGSYGTQMPFVWPLLPVMAVAAIVADRRLALFLIVIVLVDLVAHSIASQKATRYVYHFFPLICMVWGIGFQQLIVFLSEWISSRMRMPSAISAVLALTLAMSCIVSTQEFRRALKLVLGMPLENDVVALNQEPDFVKIKKIIDPMLPEVDRLVASSGFKALFAFDRYDYELHGTVVKETDTGQEFGLDRRTGRRVIGSADSVDKVIDMDGTELFILENRMMNTAHGANEATVQEIESRCTAIEVPAESAVSAWICAS